MAQTLKATVTQLIGKLIQDHSEMITGTPRSGDPLEYLTRFPEAILKVGTEFLTMISTPVDSSSIADSIITCWNSSNNMFTYSIHSIIECLRTEKPLRFLFEVPSSDNTKLLFGLSLSLITNKDLSTSLRVRYIFPTDLRTDDTHFEILPLLTPPKDVSVSDKKEPSPLADYVKPQTQEEIVETILSQKEDPEIKRYRTKYNIPVDAKIVTEDNSLKK